jgi:hypothetical protein
MKKAWFALACVLLGSLLLVQASSSATYDPWVDLDESGDIDIFDVVTLAGSYQTTGDPTKNVYVVNWPVSSDVGVWWAESLGPSSTMYSGVHYAEGFGQLHVLAKAAYLGAGESVEIVIYGELSNPSKTAYWLTTAYTTTLTSTSSSRDITIPVPSERFKFYASADAATSCDVYLSFYLTWS